MNLRLYRPDDEPALFRLERQCPRGNPPFIHFRRCFVDRAALYEDYAVIVMEDHGQIIGTHTQVMKEVVIGGKKKKLTYGFDTRIAPTHRLLRVGVSLLKAGIDWAREQGATVGSALVLEGNQAAISMAERFTKKVRKVHLLEFRPVSPLESPAPPLERHHASIHAAKIEAELGSFDLYAPGVAERLAPFGFHRFCSVEEGCAVSVFDQARVFMQISLDSPYPETEEQIAALGCYWRMFDAIGVERGAVFAALVRGLRQQAAVSGVNKITWLTDGDSPLPESVLEQAHRIRTYWLLFGSEDETGAYVWEKPIYVDARDL